MLSLAAVRDVLAEVQLTMAIYGMPDGVLRLIGSRLAGVVHPVDVRAEAQGAATSPSAVQAARELSQ